MATILKMLAAWIGTGIVLHYFGLHTMLIIMGVQVFYIMFMAKD